MQEIKFRWVGRNRKFDEITINSDLTTSKLLEGNVLTFFNGSNRGKTGNCEFLSEDLFTGLTTTKGIDVYAGDIIKTERNTVEVIFGKRTFNVFIYGKKDIIEVNGWLVRNKKGETDVLDSSFLEGDVIGTIHTTPELLK